MDDLSLVGFTVENLRGFQKAHLDLSTAPLVLVGPNNAGKTGMLRLLDWILNEAEDSLLNGDRELSIYERELLLPARSTRGRARRLTLGIWVDDRRRHGRLKATDDIASLRVRIVKNHLYLGVGAPVRSEPERSEPVAFEFLYEIRRSVDFRLIPATRSTDLSEFQAALESSLLERIEKKAVHRSRGGAPAEYRAVKKALDDITDVVGALVEPLWSEIHAGVLPGMSETAVFQIPVGVSDIVKWLTRRIRLRLVTGEHDVYSVSPHEVGSGLQSLLHLSVLRTMQDNKKNDVILAIEEPETFLHPSAQRALARTLFTQENAQVIVSTHSPLFVDEAQYDSLAMIRDHNLFTGVDTERQRVAINTSLLTGAGSELPFCESVLFVEGEGDRLFFETLRRRLAAFDPSGVCDRLLVLAVGGKTRFSPWIRLSDSFRDDANGRAISWLVTADGIDAAEHVRSGFRGAGISIPLLLGPRFDAVIGARSSDYQDALIQETERLNFACRRMNFRLHLQPIDLEWTALEIARDSTARRIAERVGFDVSTVDELLALLGSKADVDFARQDNKQPWMRAIVAEELAEDELSIDAIAVIRRWLVGAVGTTRRANALLRRAGWLDAS